MGHRVGRRRLDGGEESVVQNSDELGGGTCTEPKVLRAGDTSSRCHSGGFLGGEDEVRVESAVIEASESWGIVEESST